MVIVEKDKCTGCGLCVRICHHHCIECVQDESGNTIRIDRELCSTCSQCVAVCPRQALSWNVISPQVFNSQNRPTADQVEELLKQRRTVRHYQDRPIERSALEEISAIGGFAPTNDFYLRSVICDDRELIRELDRITLRKITRYYDLAFKNRLIFNFLESVSPNVNKIMRMKFQRSVELGTTFDSPPAAIIFVIGNTKTLQAAESAQFAVYNMMLFAQAKGLGSCYLAAGQVVFSSNPRVRNLLGLQKGEAIYGSLQLGVPAVKFRSKVAGKELPVSFVGGECRE
jgi:NAD-dependent dihydropyrimidine dehydrogenase PreA subunit/nitroreductase